MTDRPTDRANENFALAADYASKAEHFMSLLHAASPGGKLQQHSDRDRGEMVLAAAVGEIAKGLKQLSRGVRATYMLLEEINRKLPK
jgi:hypothetical protein